ncbi:hypothetical protein [Streptomyces sp. YIM 130001]|uniref:hypothetical protein n=1 Tax=Streptomyces sp. YIM 130001 TaxID=2259644 RepID=UPI0013C5122A|nr:hypothetical protein [Streptomyces sp. YIM 130001]
MDEYRLGRAVARSPRDGDGNSRPSKALEQVGSLQGAEECLFDRQVEPATHHLAGAVVERAIRAARTR